MSESKRPDDLVDVTPGGYVVNNSDSNNSLPTPDISARPKDLVSVDPDYVAEQISPYNTVTGVASGAGAVRPLIEKIANSDATNRRSMETYLRSQRHHNLPGLDLAALEKEFQKLYSPDSRIATYSEVQDALKAVKGEVPGIPKADLSAYKTIAKPTTLSGKANQLLKKTGEIIEDVSVPGGGFAKQSFRAAGRGGLGFGAGYEAADAYNKLLEGDVAGAIPSASSAAGYGALLATNPKIKGAGAVLAGLPLVGKYFTGDAQAAPMNKEDVTGTGFDLATSLMGPASLALSPSQLGEGTLRPKREVYRPGMSVLEGTRLAPELRAEGGLVYLAEGGAPKKSRASIAGTLNEVGTVQGPNLSTMARDYIAQLPATTEKNLRHQQDVMNRAMPIDPKTGQLVMNSDPEAMREMTDMVSGMGGMTKVMGSAARKAAHEYANQAPGRMTDWLQNHIGKYIVPTQSDRMGGVGGVSFSANSLALPEYKGMAWGSGNKPVASGITNLAKDPRFGGPENQIFVPLIGEQNQHKSNQIVFDKLMAAFHDDPKALTPELRAKINSYMQSGGGIDPRTGASRFSTFADFDAADKDTMGLLGKSFDNRGLIAQHVFGGKGIDGKKSQIIPYQQMLDDLADPTVKGAPTFAVGPRAFQLTGKVHETPRPDLNAAFPHLLEGRDLNVTNVPVENRLLFRDFQNQWRADRGKTDQVLKSGLPPEPGYFENTLGYKVKPTDKERVYPRQKVDEQLLDTMYKSGNKKGGLV